MLTGVNNLTASRDLRRQKAKGPPGGRECDVCSWLMARVLSAHLLIWFTIVRSQSHARCLRRLRKAILNPW